MWAHPKGVDWITLWMSMKPFEATVVSESSERWWIKFSGVSLLRFTCHVGLSALPALFSVLCKLSQHSTKPFPLILLLTCHFLPLNVTYNNIRELLLLEEPNPDTLPSGSIKELAATKYNKVVDIQREEWTLTPFLIKKLWKHTALTLLTGVTVTGHTL